MRDDARTIAARAARAEMTVAERILWARLRRRAVRGWKFRRQGDFGPYLVDFLCHDPPLVVEIDGPAHGLWRGESDARRDAWLTAQGFVVLRIPERDARCDIDGVIARIEATGARISPSPASEGGGIRPAPSCDSELSLSAGGGGER
jgi:very-short-patch-repair endonuclease